MTTRSTASDRDEAPPEERRIDAVWLVALAIGFFVLALAIILYWTWPRPAGDPVPVPVMPAAVPAEPAPPFAAPHTEAPEKAVAALRRARGEPDLPEPEPEPAATPPGDADALPEAIDEPEPIDEAPTFEFSESPYGVPGGVAAFPPMGTDKLQRGIVVPDDFPVPEGFVKHYQVTDEGEQLPPILMFHPDYELLDEQGEPIELPENRVVPPELAPEDLPIEILELPPEEQD